MLGSLNMTLSSDCTEHCKAQERQRKNKDNQSRFWIGEWSMSMDSTAEQTNILLFQVLRVRLEGLYLNGSALRCQAASVGGGDCYPLCFILQSMGGFPIWALKAMEKRGELQSAVGFPLVTIQSHCLRHNNMATRCTGFTVKYCPLWSLHRSSLSNYQVFCFFYGN